MKKIKKNKKKDINYTVLRSGRQYFKLKVVSNIIEIIFDNWELAWHMALRELKALNKGAFLGMIWLIINPLIQVLVYVIVVSIIFKSKLTSTSNTFDYAIYVLSGMIPWQILTKSLQEAPSLIRDRMDLVKQVIYPVEILPIINLIVNSVSLSIITSIYLVLTLTAGKFNFTFFIIPIPMLILIILITGISWILSVLGVVIKDIREIIYITLNLSVYCSPLVLSEAMVSPKIWSLVLLNPFSHILICFRDIFLGQFHAVSWYVYINMTIIIFILGSFIINRFKLLINEYI
jgi:lipopolysaccharide transport system permease protein